MVSGLDRSRTAFYAEIRRQTLCWCTGHAVEQRPKTQRHVFDTECLCLHDVAAMTATQAGSPHGGHCCVVAFLFYSTEIVIRPHPDIVLLRRRYGAVTP